jgi:hypothetical protein
LRNFRICDASSRFQFESDAASGKSHAIPLLPLGAKYRMIPAPPHPWRNWLIGRWCYDLYRHLTGGEEIGNV